MNPFNRKNDTPKNPLTAMEKADDIQGEIGDTPMDASNKVTNVQPGGRPQTTLGSTSGDRMQYSREGGQSYSGSMVYSKKVNPFS